MEPGENGVSGELSISESSLSMSLQYRVLNEQENRETRDSSEVKLRQKTS